MQIYADEIEAVRDCIKFLDHIPQLTIFNTVLGSFCLLEVVCKNILLVE